VLKLCKTRQEANKIFLGRAYRLVAFFRLKGNKTLGRNKFQMTEQTQLQTLGNDTRPMFDRFWSIIAPYQFDLWNYCRKIAGNPWDGEDLYQDTIMKTFTSLSSLSIRSQILHPKSYLFRVATNHWIDICRKQQRNVTEEYLEERTILINEIALFEIYETFEHLLQYIPPKQAVAIVLVDAFQFTANEAAEIIGTTEGAVSASLFRARRTLRNMAQNDVEINKKTPPSAADTVLIQKYVEYFNVRDFEGIAGLLAEHAVFSFVTQSSKEYGRDEIMKASHHPSHYQRNDLLAIMKELWGKPTVIFYNTDENGNPIALNEVSVLDIEDGHIIGIKGYFFCPEFMEAAATKLGVPREKWN
jgi:RNA polymerase sigma factor (sigma-70 family)